ncbi:aryl-sulfate sulfotransferase [Magnetospirillum sp. ME-1]|uniref:ribbon-helix-helix domain-containing protein n=1 Tax=Magnetospirillum sp. ME-1 TaxID=1639348 RepID=UPI000A179857|nr:ribbon-helix-helix domain-containing protein [Magnetospirillum sp. ME-1]ARJ67357.1 aryl-sulfate sulfotransferase [Magnetospirillum sp. ME-1]
MTGLPAKRSVKIAGHATSVTLEPEFWECLRELSEERNLSINQMVAEIDCSREANLSSAIRVFVLNELKRKAAG